MKKLLIPAIIILVFMGSATMTLNTFSDEYSDLIGDANETLSQDVSDLFTIDECVTNECCMAYKGAMGYFEKAWSDNLDDLMDQEKPDSEMVGEAFENMRTYQCWLEYICRSVQVSGYMSPTSILSTGLTSKELGIVPGCQAPEDMGLLTTREAFYNFIMDNWDFVKNIYSSGGTVEVNMDFPDTFFTSNGMLFFPQCMTDITNKNTTPDIAKTQENYNLCRGLLESKFACNDTEEGIKNCTDESSAFAKVETALRKNNGDQKARILEDKLKSIITKMITMQEHVKYMNANFQQLDSRYACYPPKC